jgi:hypothetical protein
MFLSRKSVRAIALIATSVLMLILFASDPIRPIEPLRTRYSPPSVDMTDTAQRKGQETVILALANNANAEIRLRLGAEDRWFDYKFVLVGSLLGAFLARFTFGRRVLRHNAEVELDELLSSNLSTRWSVALV